MSNKIEFYQELQKINQDRKSIITFLKDFQKSHHGVLWQPAGKDDFRIKFRQSEQWWMLSTWPANFESQVMKNLENQVSIGKAVLGLKRTLELADDQQLTFEEVVEALGLSGNLSKLIEDSSKQVQQQDERIRKLEAENKDLAKERLKLQRAVSNLTEWIKTKKNRISPTFDEVWEEHKGLTLSLNQAQVVELRNRVIKLFE